MTDPQPVPTIIRIDPDYVPEVRPTASWVELDGEAVVYEEKTGSLHLFDPIGTLVWQLFDGVTDLRTLADELAEAFGADGEQILTDVLAMTRRLADQGLLMGTEVTGEISAPLTPQVAAMGGECAPGDQTDDLPQTQDAR